MKQMNQLISSSVVFPIRFGSVFLSVSLFKKQILIPFEGTFIVWWHEIFYMKFYIENEQMFTYISKLCTIWAYEIVFHP